MSADTLYVETGVLFVHQGKKRPVNGSWSYTTADPLFVTLSVWEPNTAPMHRDFSRERVAAGLMGEFHKTLPICVDWGRGTVDIELPGLNAWVTISANLTADFLDSTEELVPRCTFPAYCVETDPCAECNWCRLVVESELRLMGIPS